MTGIYEHALGSEVDELHPKVRERYSIDSDDNLISIGRGKMDISRGTHVLPALYVMPARNLLFPEAGDNVPFTLKTIGFREESGYEVLATIREFDFDQTHRRYDSLTVWDADNERLLDFLGTGGNLVAELNPRVEGGILIVESNRQWFRFDDQYVRLPESLAVSVKIRDRYDEVDDQFYVNAVIENALAGHVFSYRGMFTHETDEIESVPSDMQTTTEIYALPPK
jgi:hypothetical protein